jgi:hypothetical protein
MKRGVTYLADYSAQEYQSDSMSRISSQLSNAINKNLLNEWCLDNASAAINLAVTSLGITLAVIDIASPALACSNADDQSVLHCC